MNLWRLVVHHENPEDAIRSILNTKRIAIGWYETGDIGKEGYQSASEITRKIREVYPQLDPKNAAHGGSSLWAFFHEVKRGDLVILTTSNVGKRRRAVVVIEGEYNYNEDGMPDYDDEYPHQRQVIPIEDGKLPDVLWDLSGGTYDHATLVKLM